MNQVLLQMASNGRLVIPGAMRAEIGMPDGGKFVARIEKGAVILEPVDAALERVRRLVRAYVPSGVSLSGELIAERRAAAQGE